MSEEWEYYPRIAHFLKTKYHCFATGETTGSGHVGLADVIGIRDTGGPMMPDVEVIAVEVKLDTSSLGKSLGQALGYSLFADKCYLAVPMGKKGFSLEQIEMATHLGVGLINCRKSRIREVATSSPHSPIPALRTRVIWNLDYALCCLCGNAVEAPEDGTARRLRVVEEEGRVLGIRKLLKDDGSSRRLLFTERSRPERERAKYHYLCQGCFKLLKKIR